MPLLAVVCNNRSFFNDEVHQERVAKVRGRPVENRWIGQRIDEPAPDLGMIARAQGSHGIGPVTERRSSQDALRRCACGAVEATARPSSSTCTSQPGYNPAMAAGITRAHG